MIAAIEQTGNMASIDRDSGLFAAVMSVAAGLELKSTLRRIVTSAADLVEAQYGALAVLGPNGEVEEFIHVGMPEEDAALIGDLPKGAGILGLLIDHPVPIRLDNLADHPASIGFPDAHPPMKSFLGVPIRVRGDVFGNLYLTQKHDDQQFTAEDEQTVGALAAAAGVAIENARLFEQSKQAQERISQLLVHEDRDRIARDLHDLVIQRLFAVGMSLQTVIRHSSLDETTEQRMERAIDDLDQTVKEIRQTIFDLHQDESAESLRTLIRHELEMSKDQLGFDPQLILEGPVDTLVPENFHEHVVAVIREGLSNIARHAYATSAQVKVAVHADSITITIVDDGRGFTELSRTSGLDNLSHRATALQGSCSLEPGDVSGSTLTWSAALS